jgi:hypothetical protein
MLETEKGKKRTIQRNRNSRQKCLEILDMEMSRNSRPNGEKTPKILLLIYFTSGGFGLGGQVLRVRTLIIFIVNFW